MAETSRVDVKLEPASESSNDGSGEPASDVSGSEESSKSGASRRRTSMNMMKDDKICRVCGDKALGCNFDAVSCESCKAFFRRNALKNKPTKCLFTGNCVVDVHTRRFCPHCRLQKCFDIGMRKDLILGDAEKRKRLEKVIQNREKRQKVGHNSQDTTPVASPSSVSTHNLVSDIQDQVTQSITVQEIITDHLPLGNQFVTVAMDSNLLTLCQLARPPAYKCSEAFESAVDTSVVEINRVMTHEEATMFSELKHQYEVTFCDDCEPHEHVTNPNLNQLVNQSSNTVLLLIKFAKRLEDFIKLPQDCQIRVLKGAVLHTLLLRSVSLYDVNRDIWVTPRGEISTDILKGATGYNNLHDEHVNFCKTFKSLFQNDVNLVMLCLVIVMFSPEVHPVIHREILSNVQDKYMVLLKHYLEMKYSYVTAATMFPQMLFKVKELKELAENHAKYLMDVNPHEIDPLMLEILDLK